MEWFEIDVYTTTAGIDLVCSKLSDIGIKGFVIQDYTDWCEFINDENPKWDYIDDALMEQMSDCETIITAYLPDNSQGAEMIITLESVLMQLRNSDIDGVYGKLETVSERVRESDWADNWKKYFKPLRIGEKITVKPSWEDVTETADRIVVEIDPASSFGTGQHHTTRLCLELLESTVNNGDNLLDLGCGSGILSVAGLLLGANRAVAVDIDENAAAAARENARKNGISDKRYSVYCGNILSDEQLADGIRAEYDIITANIVADVLIAMSRMFRGYLKDGGSLIVSGIIEERADEVVNAIEECGFKKSASRTEDGWTAVQFII